MKDVSKWKHEPWLKLRAYDKGSGLGKTPKTQPHFHMLWKCKGSESQALPSENHFEK